MDNIEQADAGFNNPDVANCTVSGVILGAIGAGVPQSLTIPCRPWNKPDARGENAGKAPAVPAPEFPDGNGPWVGLDGWERCETPRARVDQADAASANCGLVLNVPGESPAGRFNFLAIDIDLDKGHPEYAGHRNTIMLELSKHLGGSRMMWRETLPQRALLLVSVKDMTPGRKHVWKIKHGGAELGESKIELLAHGQQCVIAGRHHTGRDIFWRVADRPGKRWSAPPLYDVKPVEFDDFESVVAMLESAFAALQGEGYEFPTPSAGSTGTAGGDNDVPVWLTVAKLADALDRMSNPASFDRDQYTSLCEAVAGCRKGIIAHHGPLSDADENRLADAVAGWASRWKGPKPGDFDTERAKWLDDWRDNGDFAGWRHLIDHAKKLGVDLAGESAQTEFTAEPPPPGGTSDSPDFDNIGPKPSPEPTLADLGIWDAGDDDYQIPPRGWLLGNVFCRRFLSSLLADGGTGKTALRIAQLASLASGRHLTGEKVFQRCKVLVVSLEDDRDELRRRVYAVLKHYGISPEEVKGWLFLAAPKGLKLASMVNGSVQLGALEKLIREAVTTYGLDIVSLDPFVKAHGMGENDNNAIDHVCTLLTKLAIDLDCAIDAPHHTRKGLREAGDADAGRGAGSMKDAARLVYTLTRMTPEEAKQFGISEAERRQYIRMDSGKVNITPASDDAKWFRLVGVPLLNTTPQYPAGDQVQTVEVWTPPDIWQGMTDETRRAILAEIDAGLPNGRRYSTHNRADDRSARHVVRKHLLDLTDEQAGKVIAAWIKGGLLIEADYDDPVVRKSRKGLFLNPEKQAQNAAP